MEFKGTKGEWYVSKDCNVFSKLVEERVKNHKDAFVRISTDGEIAKCWTDLYDNTIIPDEEGKANAQLIASAPELLEALNEQHKFLIYCRDNMKVSRPVFNQKALRLEKLIEKATKID